MITTALDARLHASWVAGDEAYSAGRDLRPMLRDRQIGYVLAIFGDRRVTARDGRRRTAAQVRATPGSGPDTARRLAPVRTVNDRHDCGRSANALAGRHLPADPALRRPGV